MKKEPTKMDMTVKIFPLKEVKEKGWYLHLEDFKTSMPSTGWFYEYNPDDARAWRNESGCADCGPFDDKDLFLGPFPQFTAGFIGGGALEVLEELPVEKNPLQSASAIPNKDSKQELKDRVSCIELYEHLKGCKVMDDNVKIPFSRENVSNAFTFEGIAKRAQTHAREKVKKIFRTHLYQAMEESLAYLKEKAGCEDLE